MTRPRDANTRFLGLLPEDMLSRLAVIQSPLLDIVPVADGLDLNACSAVIFTSGEGVRVASEKTNLRPKAFCVGRRTTEYAHAAGWAADYVGAQSDDLVDWFLTNRPVGKFIHLHGECTRGKIAQRLAQSGLNCHDQVIYQQRLRNFTPEAMAAVTAQIPLIVPLFSPRTAAHFVSLCPDMSHLILIAMSDAVAEALPRLQSHSVHVSKAPTAIAMAELLRDVAAPFVRVETGQPGD
ncbi:uroporphyrinogen-III synthase [Tritonibacter horizontis]|nr:uroporphyrinogen-III synthase [Tritonibacter horizontis]